MSDTLNLLDGLDVEIPVAPSDAHQGAGASSAQSGAFFGPYQLLQEVGVGGVARVMRARHMHPRYADVTFAIKILHDELSRDAKVVKLFRHEAYVLSMLKHPNIVRTFEGGVQDNKLFIAMEYIAGRDLDNLVTRCRKMQLPIPLQVSMYVMGEVLKGLSYAHGLCDADGNRLALVHRDVNPANVFLSYDGRVKLGDFGVASITAGRTEKSRELAGKAGYFAPEQLAGEAIDQRADLFAIGVMMFEVLTGQRLFEGADADEVLRLNRKAKIPRLSKLNPELPAGLEDVIQTALERKPQDRFESGVAMFEALRPFIPEPAGMALAVAALVRKAFVREHTQELQLREEMGGIARGSGQCVVVCAPDERAQLAFNELLTSRGYRVEIVPNAGELGSWFTAHGAPHVVLLDVSPAGLSVPAARAAVAAAGGRPAVVAVSDGLGLETIRRADELGAVDLLFKPFNIEQVLTAVRGAITGAVRVASSSASSVATAVHQSLKVLVLSREPDFLAATARGLTERGLTVEVARSPAEAVERTSVASYDAFVYDAFPPSPSDRFFASQVRARAGMGLVPILYLVAAEAQSGIVGGDADRSAVRKRGESAAVLADVLRELVGDTRLGRTFVRYGVQLIAELRYGGRVFAAETIDLSRGGLMLRCAQMPPVGEDVSVTLRLPNESELIEVTGRVIRVDLPHHEGEAPGIGVTFTRFAQRGEARFIAFLSTLDKDAARTRTVILGTSSPGRS